jgi:epoxyqueuosine reductase
MTLVRQILPTARVGFAKLERPLSMDLYDAFLREGLHGEMKYLERHRDAKAEPQRWLPFAQSAIVLSFDYVTMNNLSPLRGKRVALYTSYAEDQEDYHLEIKRRISPVIQSLQSIYPEAIFRISLDTEPIMERDLAYRAGLGWIGKNTCLIGKNSGSLFFIAEILTSLKLTEIETTQIIPSPDHCGTCTKCIEACPTGALAEPRKLDARKCISYWTIEAKAIAPQDLRKRFGDWFFGCDICQTVCPWNAKVFGKDQMASLAQPIQSKTDEERKRLGEELREILTISNREIERRFAKSPLRRARGFGLKRNALYVIENLHLTELADAVETLKSDEKLGELSREVWMSLLNAP